MQFIFCCQRKRLIFRSIGLTVNCLHSKDTLANTCFKYILIWGGFLSIFQRQRHFVIKGEQKKSLVGNVHYYVGRPLLVAFATVTLKLMIEGGRLQQSDCVEDNRIFFLCLLLSLTSSQKQSFSKRISISPLSLALVVHSQVVANSCQIVPTRF